MGEWDEVSTTPKPRKNRPVGFVGGESKKLENGGGERNGIFLRAGREIVEIVKKIGCKLSKNH